MSSLSDDIALWLETKDTSSQDLIESMICKDLEYHADPFYFNTKQNEVTWMMRAILVDWMTEVSSEFCLKRDTLYQAINFVDRYLSVQPKVPK